MNFAEKLQKVFLFGGFSGRGSSDKVYGLEAKQGELASAWKSEGTLYGPRDSHESIAISEGKPFELLHGALYR